MANANPSSCVTNAAANHSLDHQIEVLHSFQLTIVHCFQESLAFGLTLFNVFAASRGSLKDFDGGDSPFSVSARNKSLRYDVTKGLRKTGPDDVLF